MVLEISSTLAARLLSDAAASPDAEICGLLFGDARRIERAEACANVADDPARAFEIDPAALFAALRAERAGGPTLLGYWHSHPNGDAKPSFRDLASARLDGKVWMILAGDMVTAWRAAESTTYDWVEGIGPAGRCRTLAQGATNLWFNRIPLLTEDVRHLIPLSKRDEDLVPLIAAAGYPAIAPILDDLLPWIADPNWPIAPPLIEYFTTLGAIMVEPIRRLLQNPDSDTKDGCLTFLVARLEPEAQANLIDEMRALATAPNDKDRYYEVDVAAREILERLKTIRP